MMRARLTRLVLLVVAVGLLLPAEAEARRRKKRKEKRLPPVPTWTPPPVAEPPVERAPNSLWTSRTQALTSDLRAHRVNDLLTIRILESSIAESQVTTDTSRDADASFGLPNLAGLTESLASTNLSPASLLNGNTSNSFSGDGSTRRQESLTTLVTGRVVAVLPNGNLHVEAAREITINNERQYLLVAGVVRPRDVASDNSVLSTQVADLRVVFAGVGDLSKVQKKGWFLKALSWILPF
ncbi:MAG: flagellar basal body L-ring protein FlgH [Acidobacteriota bacterium]